MQRAFQTEWNGVRRLRGCLRLREARRVLGAALLMALLSDVCHFCVCAHMAVINKAKPFFKAGCKTALLFVRKDEFQASPAQGMGGGACRPSLSWLQSRKTLTGRGGGAGGARGGIEARGLQAALMLERLSCSSHLHQASTHLPKPRLKGSP